MDKGCTAHVIWLALMMVIKNSCVPVSFPAYMQEQKKYPTSFEKAPRQTRIQHTMLKFVLLVICFDFTSRNHSGASMMCLFGKPMLNDSTSTCTERNGCL